MPWRKIPAHFTVPPIHRKLEASNVANRYKVQKKDDTHVYVVGLKEEFGPGPDTILLYHYTAEESETPDVDTPGNVHQMYGALYDLLQCHDGLKRGDILETEFGEFECQGCHLEPLFPYTPKP